MTVIQMRSRADETGLDEALARHPTARKIRCRVLTLPNRYPCPNEELNDTGVCIWHMKEIGEAWNEMITVVAGAHEAAQKERP